MGEAFQESVGALGHMARVSFRHIWPLIGSEAEVGGRTCLNGQEEKC